MCIRDSLYQVYKRMPTDVQDKWDSAYAQRISEYRNGNLKGKELISWKYPVSYTHLMEP